MIWITFAPLKNSSVLLRLYCPLPHRFVGLWAILVGLVVPKYRAGMPTSNPLQGAQPTPSHCALNCKCQPHWHLYPTVTAPNRFGNHLQPPV